MPAVIFESDDYYGIMADECKFTIPGRFWKIRPQIEKIRPAIKETIPLRGTVKIGVYDNKNVFIDVYNEEDFNTIYCRHVIEIEGQPMWLTRWSPDFTPEEDSPLTPVWVLLPKLPFHLHTWHHIKQILSPTGVSMAMDIATKGRTRLSMAKVRVEINLSKPRLNHVFAGQRNATNPLQGHEQKIEYEGVPKYCNHCRLQGHYMSQCRRLERVLAENEEIPTKAYDIAENQGEQQRDLAKK